MFDLVKNEGENRICAHPCDTADALSDDHMYVLRYSVQCACIHVPSHLSHLIQTGWAKSAAEMNYQSSPGQADTKIGGGDD
jgi:hypothetical protein